MRAWAAAAVGAGLALAVAAAGCTDRVPEPVGEWVLAAGGAVYLIDFGFGGGGVVTAGSGLLDQQQVDSFRFRTDIDIVTFSDDSMCRSVGADGEGRYVWRKAGEQLQLTAQEDQCEPRRSLLDGAVLSPAAPAPQGPALGPAVADPVAWWNDAVFYEVFVRSYSDSDGDGNGDLRGLIGKLDYLSDLGVNALWLMPIMESPSYHGYDTTDYFAVEQDYGSNRDFVALTEAAHRRGMRVIVDLVLNHTSSEHPWFAAAVADPADARRDFYLWRPTDDGAVAPWGTPMWHRSETGYYFGLFWEGMPDLNHRNPDVTAQLSEAAPFWLQDMGADGFRLDAVRHLIEEDGAVSGTPATHAWLRAWDDRLDAVDPQALTVGEVWDAASVVAPYVTDDEVDIAFEFGIAEGILRSVLAARPAEFVAALSGALAAYPAGQFAPFLTNHDQNRVMSQLSGDLPRAKLAAAALLTLPGVPFLYYGEEIGMTGEKPDERIRTPMLWDGSANAGFTSGVPWQALSGDATSVAAQIGDPASLLSHYRALLAARADYAALRTGGLVQLDPGCSGVTAFLRGAGKDAVLVLLNFADAPQSGCAVTGRVAGAGPAEVTLRDALGSGAETVLSTAEDGAIAATGVAVQAQQALVLVPSR